MKKNNFIRASVLIAIICLMIFLIRYLFFWEITIVKDGFTVGTGVTELKNASWSDF